MSDFDICRFPLRVEHTWCFSDFHLPDFGALYSNQMALPTITEQNIKDLLPSVTGAIPSGRGGQKIVFRIELEGQAFALKFALLSDAFQPDIADIDETVLRARRETQIMQECKSPHIVKVGPVDLGTAAIDGQNVLYFSEEFIDGQALSDAIRESGPLTVPSVVKLGQQMCSAIDELWSLGKIHRDIKPSNIMQRSHETNFVLLDAGLAFDVAGESISAGFLVGTMAYFSPEQFDYTNRRVMDFRSDMFSLGVTLYEAATGQHPFLSPTTSTPHLYTKITKHNPPSPSSINPLIPGSLDKVILRMMGKSPHLRYRRISQLQEALALI
ncbi:serine/threonine-protein kinase [Granulicella sp. dw_53]|uniref:serine/threonine-protein kinase n=1 Tax=Granulicella sp. dw_53 TaxID=2719792 RepID=UPI001BD3049A|nr:serine/threonine-protein kinase [Granulicella sp. dw_53]